MRELIIFSTIAICLLIVVVFAGLTAYFYFCKKVGDLEDAAFKARDILVDIKTRFKQQLNNFQAAQREIAAPGSNEVVQYLEVRVKNWAYKNGLSL